MKFLRFLCALGVLCGYSLRAFTIDREAFTFTKYDLDVRVDAQQQRLAVRGPITLRNDSSSPQKSFSLQISSSLDWRSIQADGKPVQFVSQAYASDIDHTGALSEAIVTLPQEVPPKGIVNLDIGYEGVIVLDATRLTRIGVPEDKAKHSDWDQIGKTYAAVRGVGYVTWYPVAIESANLSEGKSLFEALSRWKSKEAQAEMNIKLDATRQGAPATILCNGQETEKLSEEIEASYQVGLTCSFHPLASVVPLFVIGDYESLDRPVPNISYLPEHKTAANNFGLSADLVTPLTKEWFGTPHETIKVVDLNDPEAAAYESGNVLLTPLAKVDSRLYELTAVHELTHAAFPSPRLWIYEGLAHFAQALDREQHNDRQGALDFMAQFRPTVVDAQKSASAERNPAAAQSLINTNIEEFYRSKAMFVWWMLRDMVGGDAIKKALANYKPEQDKDPSYMQQLIEAQMEGQTQRKLQWFFDDWVYNDRGLPDFRVDSAYARTSIGGGYFVTVTIENTGAAGAEVPLILKTERGEVTKQIEVRAKSKASTRIDAPSLPEEVVINDGSVPESDVTDNSFKIELSSK